MKTIQQKTTQTIIGLTSMKLPSLSLISRLVSLAAIVSIVAAPPQSARAQAPGGVDTTFNAGSGPNVNPTAVAIQTNGKVVIYFPSGGGNPYYTNAGTFRVIYRVGDAQVGQWSAPVSVIVGG
jgi:hypothetical protein